MATEYLTTDIDLKKVADGIRSRTGKTAPLAFPDGYVTEISTLTNTSDATVTAGDMAEGVVAYGKNGRVVGDIVKSALPSNQMSLASTSIETSDGQIWFKGNFDEGTVIASKSRIGTYIDFLGDATAADVAKGKTFTSAAGLNVVGTAGGAEPVVIYLPQTGLANLKSYTLTHNLGRKPAAIYCMKGAMSSSSDRIQWFNAVLDPKTTTLILCYATSNEFGTRGQANVSEFPSSGFVGRPYYIQIGNANETTIDFKFGETSSYAADLYGAVFIVY